MNSDQPIAAICQSEGTVPRAGTAEPSATAPVIVPNCPNCPPIDCKQSVGRYLAGDRTVGGELEAKFRPLVWSIVMEKLTSKHREDWEDCVQTVWQRVFSGLGTWKGTAPFCKWLAIVASNVALDRVKTPSKTIQSIDDDIPDRPPPVAPEVIECIETTAAKFTPELRQLYELKVQGLRLAAIAKQLGKSERTIHYWLKQMRALLKH